MAPVTPAPQLVELDAIPEGLLEIPADRLHTLLPGPALLHLAGGREPPLFVSVLLHGNESAGLSAVQRLLKKYRNRPLPRALSIFFGNIEAAKHGVRRLDGQPDFNRVWPGTPHEPCAETALMAGVVEAMARRKVFASIDVHNNTGLNPHYACVNRLDHRFFHLATMFNRLVTYFTHPKGTQTAAFAALCPAVTLECGKSEHAHGAEHAFEYLDACLHLAEVPDHPVAAHDIDLYHTLAQVTVREDCAFGFQGENLDLLLNDDLDHLNFTDLAAGTDLGEVADHLDRLPVQAMDETGRDVAGDYFEIQEGRLALKKSLMPSMFTLDEKIIRQDCLGYLMERITTSLGR
ncbi:M14 family metallopeptidase [Methylomagnum sp.]